MKVLVAGASGLIGNHLLQELITENKFSEIIVLVRKKIDVKSSKIEQIIFDFNDISSYQKLSAVDALFCCLGTTIKKAKSKENFLKVDYEYPLLLAKHIKAKQFHLVSSMGANAKSSVFYTQTKGQLEEALSTYKLDSLQIYRPSQLSGNRKEFRLGESISKPILKAFSFLTPAHYKLIKASTVAKAMKTIAIQNIKGGNIYLSNDIKKIAQNDL